MNNNNYFKTYIAPAAPFFIGGAFEGAVPGVLLRTWQTSRQTNSNMPPIRHIIAGSGPPYAFAVGAFFGTSAMVKIFAEKHFKQKALPSAIWAGIGGTATLNPIEMHIVHKIIYKKSGWQPIFKQLGIRGFFVGAVPAMQRNIAVAIGSYFLPSMNPGQSLSKKVARAYLYGMILGAASQIPDNISTEMKKIALITKKRVSFVETTKMMWKKGGIYELNKGLLIRCGLRIPICMVIMQLANIRGMKK